MRAYLLDPKGEECVGGRTCAAYGGVIMPQSDKSRSEADYTNAADEIH